MTVEIRSLFETYPATVTILGDYTGKTLADFEAGLGSYNTPGAFSAPDSFTLNGTTSATLTLKVGESGVNPVAADYYLWGRYKDAPNETLTRRFLILRVITTGGSPIGNAIDYVQTVNDIAPDADGNVDVSGGGGDVQTVAGVSPDGAGNVPLTAADVGADTSGTAATAQAAAIAAAATDATTKANAAQSAATSAAATDATTKANAAQAAAISAAATDATSKVAAEATARNTAIATQHTADLAAFDAAGAASTAQAAAISTAASDATTKVAAEAVIARAAESANATAITNEATTARTAEGLKLAKASNLSDVANAGTSRTNLGLGNVDNTSDANKPVSTAQATAIALKTTTLVPTATKTATYAPAVGDLAMMNVAGGATILNLPSAPADKSQVGVVAIGATSGVPLTINRGGSDTISTSGATSVTLQLSGELLVLQYDAGNARWLSVSNIKSLTALDARYAALASPAFTGTPTAPTPTAADNSTKLATTAYVDTADALKAPLASPALTGNPTATTQAAGNNSTRLATTAYVDTADNLKANLASPTFTGTPAAPTAGAGTNTTQLATTAFVTAATPDASSSVKGLLQLTNELGGTATAPTVFTAAKLLRPTAAIAETYSRAGSAISNNGTLVSGQIQVTAIPLIKGQVVTSVSFQSGSVGAGTPTNWWFGLWDAAGVQLRLTADQTTTAWAISTLKTVALSSTYTVLADGVFYIGVMVAATTTPVLMGTTGLNSLMAGLAPVLTARDSTHTGLTTPASAPGTLTLSTLNNNHLWGYVS